MIPEPGAHAKGGAVSRGCPRISPWAKAPGRARPSVEKCEPALRIKRRARGYGSIRSLNKFSKELIESLTEAAEHAEGKPVRIRTHVVEVPDVRAIRRRLRMSQMEFARAYRIQLATIKNWAQGRRQPDAPAAAYLQVIARRPREAARR